MTVIFPGARVGRPRKPKQIGTAAETAVVRVIRANGFKHAERRALRGVHDAGDIVGCPGVVWEVKGGEAAKSCSDGVVDAWLTETERERITGQADHGVLVMQRRGIGEANAGRWWAVMPLWSVHALAHGSATGQNHVQQYASIPVRMTLINACAMLVHGGYGD